MYVSPFYGNNNIYISCSNLASQAPFLYFLNFSLSIRKRTSVILHAATPNLAHNQDLTRFHELLKGEIIVPCTLYYVNFLNDIR